MAKNSVRDFDATAANNTDIQSVDIAENCAPSGINNAIRELMADIKDVSAGTVALESPQADSLTVTGDLTVDTNTLFVDASADAVGIGTTSPVYTLHTHNSANTFSYHKITNSSTGTTSGDGLDIGISGSNALFYNLESGSMQFATSGTERMRINNSGNVGIGTTSPNADLELGGSGEVIRLSGSATTAYIRSTDGTTNQWYMGSGGNAGLQHYVYQANPITFHTSGAERMRIDSSGNLLVGTTSSPISSNKGTALLPSSLDRTIINMSSASVSSGVELIQFRNPNGQVGFIGTNASSTTYQTTSDYRLKENVTGITDGIERVKQLNPSRFNFIVDAGTTVDGFLAHEVSDIVPEAITGEKDAMKDEEYVATPATGEIYTPAQEATYDDDGNELTAAVDEIVHSTDVEQPDTLEEGRYWRETTQAVMATRSVPDYQGIDQSKLVPLLTAALQEAVAKIEALETRVAALEA